MNKYQLIEKVASRVGVSKKLVGNILDTSLEEITKVLLQGGRVALHGFGLFQVVRIKARMGVNPRTKTKIKIPSFKAPRFRAGKSLKEAVK